MRGRHIILLSVALAVGACGGGSGGGGGGGGGGTGAPSISYPSPITVRAGSALAAVWPTNAGGSSTDWTVSPALPAGLSLEPLTGRISGTPTGATPTATYDVTARNEAGEDTTAVAVQVTPALPSSFALLRDGFAAEAVVSGAASPVKMALAPDGRLFYAELSTGDVRIVDAAGDLLDDPFASVPVITGGERGLLGLALAPDFETSGHVVLYHSAPAEPGHAARNRVVRFTASGNVGTSMAVLVDDLPIGSIHNAGDVKIGPDGNLYVSLGETGSQDLSQTEGTPAGRILRYTASGGIPSDNPIAGSPEWCRGLRNSFDMTFHPTTGGLFASENGPNAQDEVNFIQSGKNYGWPSLPAGASAGFRVTSWTPVIAPTGLVFHDGTGFGAEYADDLFVCSYVDAELRRLVLSGAAFTDLDAEELFARWHDVGGVDKPIDLLQTPTGDLLVATFTAIWRIYRYP